MLDIDALTGILQEKKLYVESKFNDIVELARSTKQPIDKLLVSSGYLTEKQMLEVFAQLLDVTYYEKLTQFTPPQIFVSKISVQFARQHNVIAIDQRDNILRVATASPLESESLDEISTNLDMIVAPVFAPKAEINALINKAYQQKVDVVSEMLEGIDEKEIAGISREVEMAHDLLDLATKAPIIKLVNMLLFQALRMRASDVHLHPYEEKLIVRYRIDGVLYDMMNLPKKLQEAVISRVKIMSKMDIAEKRLPQDGRSTLKIGDSEIDVRVSSVPTLHGERIVMRLLDKTARLYELEELGLDEADHLNIVKDLINSSHGIILVTGPTGSGKTTTLYAALKQLNSTELNIITIEDPVEYHLPGISQIEISTKKGLVFATGLRSILRQDPDIIMVGEIRDLETATIAIQAALTGHLVFSTLHTNDAPGAITRLLDLGVEPYLVASSVIGVIAQRLVRKICKNCYEEYEPDPEEIQSLGIDMKQIKDNKLARGRGCPNCLNSGYYDRTGIFEVLPIDDVVRDQIMRRTGSTYIKQEAIKRGMRTLRMDGINKVCRKITTISEVLQVTQVDSFTFG